MQALCAKPKLWPFQIERKEDGLYIYYKTLLLDRIQTTSHSALSSFLLNHVIFNGNVSVSVKKGSREYYAWANLRLTCNKDWLEVDILHVDISYKWRIETDDQAKTLTAPLAARFFILQDNRLQIQSNLGYRCQVFHLDDPWERSIALEIMDVDHPVFQEFLKLIKA